jgi:glycosyltransferase involved in cell wall biosynthesis
MNELPPLRLVAFVSDFPPEDEIEGGEAIRPYELFRWAGSTGIAGRVWCIRPPRRRHTEMGTVSIRSIPFARFGAVREAVLPVLLRVLLFVESRVAARTGRQLVFYQRVPGGVTFKWDRLPVPTEPGCKLFGLTHRLGGLVWASMHDLSPDHEQSIARRNNYPADRARLVRRAGVVNERSQARALPRADLVTVVSAGMRDEVLRRYELPDDRVDILWAGIRDDFAVPPPRAGNGRLRVGYIGAASDADLAALVDATSALADRVELVIAGRRSPGQWQQLECLDHVRLIENAGYADFAAIAKDIDIWVIPFGTDPYFQLAWPLKLPMYLATGRPVVVTRTNEVMRSTYRDHLIITDPDPADLKSGIAQAVENSTTIRSSHVSVWSTSFAIAMADLVGNDQRDGQ